MPSLSSVSFRKPVLAWSIAAEDEERFLLLGLSSSLRLLVVAHCYRAEGNVIRIISARKATREEQTYYP